MSRAVLARRGLTPLSSEPARLEGWRLRFSHPGLLPPEPAFANLEPEPGATVHGPCTACRPKTWIASIASRGGRTSTRSSWSTAPAPARCARWRIGTRTPSAGCAPRAATWSAAARARGSAALAREVCATLAHARAPGPAAAGLDLAGRALGPLLRSYL